MKKIIFITTLALCASMQAQQTKNGVYLTFSDYKDHKLSYAAECSEHREIKLHEAFNGSHITFKFENKKLKLDKDSVFGVITCDKPFVRFQNRISYYLVERSAIWIFYTEVTDHQDKVPIVIKNYFFCKNGNEALVPLTVTNLKRTFPDNEKLQDMIDAQFKTEDASDYDNFHKTFKINHLINELNSK